MENFRPVFSLNACKKLIPGNIPHLRVIAKLRWQDEVGRGNKFRGSMNQPAQLTLENMRDYLHSAPILDLFMKNSTFTNKCKILAFLKYFYCFVKMSTLSFFADNKSQYNFKTKHATLKTQNLQTGRKESNIWSANIGNVVKVQIHKVFWLWNTDKRTDGWWDIFMIWKIDFGLFAVGWAGLWEKRFWPIMSVRKKKLHRKRLKMPQ